MAPENMTERLNKDPLQNVVQAWSRINNGSLSFDAGQWQRIHDVMRGCAVALWNVIDEVSNE